jgi:hypothetical protein
MEKNKLRPALAIFLFIFSFACVFAQEAGESENKGEKEAAEAAIEEVAAGETDLSVSEDQDSAPEAPKPVIKEKNKKANFTAIFANLPLKYIIAGSIFLAVVALFLISHLFLRKLINTKTNDLKKDIDEIIKNIEQKYDTQYDSIVNKAQHSSNTEDMRDIRDTIAALEKNISGLRNEISVLGNLGDLSSKVNTLYSGKRITESIASGKLDVTEAFNLWAANPVGPLPDAFYYIDGEIKIRTKREIKESAEETKWITNRSGAKQYLFPNPNSFNQMTNIPELYKMDQAKLKGKGQNKIKIITPCEMTKDGFVEFVGELELL